MAEQRRYAVTGLGDEGEGIIELPSADGHRRIDYMPLALPGDDVMVGDDGTRAVGMHPTPARRAALLCPHFPACGGCRVQHMADATYDAWKASRLTTALRNAGLGDQPIEPTIRVPVASRRRAVLTARAGADGVALGFHEHRSHQLVDIAACAILRPAIHDALPSLKQIAQSFLRKDDPIRLTVLEVSNGLDLSIATANRSGRADRDLVARLARPLATAKVQRLTVDGDIIVTRSRPLLTMSGVSVEPSPAAFVQAAAEAEAAMTRIATEAVANPKAKRVADLFCGLGPFALALAKTAAVLAVDGDRPALTSLAGATRLALGLKPIETKVRDLFRDPLSPRELDAFDAAVFDPPRAGAKEQAGALAKSKVRTVIAVSCNPATLARDLAILIEGGYAIERIVPIDQFLFTPHLEAVAVLRRPRK